ncbi:cupin domain-containing protein [Martelella radicis]|uniref:Quercetin dioxygenase-like cupin family protein n=1 Tax=Martelella radicis TaxID=1397476 RepID=A0A7W6PBN9_9HYPH|nr:cupin domain-containing protein [Martelella radicis]MBB4123641.1 quercetin dioxygenase-like cupin family protein [Martelella radicis]
MRPVEPSSENFYRWGNGCSGWRLLDLEHLQVRQETMPPSTAEEAHVHRGAHQFLYVLDGQMTILTPIGVTLIGSGQGIHIPAGQPHWVRNDDVSDLIFLLSSSPSTSGDRYPADPMDWGA